MTGYLKLLVDVRNAWRMWASLLECRLELVDKSSMSLSKSGLHRDSGKIHRGKRQNRCSKERSSVLQTIKRI